MTIRILASDLDGTLLNEESRIASETVKTVKKGYAIWIFVLLVFVFYLFYPIL